MSLTLHVDGPRWRAHLHATLESMPGLVPVAKGNGYGFGLRVLAAEAGRLGVPSVAVGEAGEVAQVRSAYDGDVLVLAPWRPADSVLDGADERVIRTVSHLEALRAVQGTGARVVVECLTSMNRHGIPAGDLAEVVPLVEGVRCEGFALHLPIDRPRGSLSDVAEVGSWVGQLSEAGVATPTLWLSHITPAELGQLRAAHPGVAFRPRVGTALWLGDPASYRATARVLDARALADGERFGYRQRSSRRAATLLVVSGGTSHGVGLEAPKAPRGPVARAKVLARAGLAAGGRSLSPFRVDGRQRWYAEPPHMQVSLVLLPTGVVVPALGDEVEVEVRMTITSFDRVLGL
jgi:hypothetical protein